MSHLFLKEHLINKFGERVQRIPLDPNLGCPNRINGHACVFCDDTGSAAPWIKKEMSIQTQLNLGADFALKRYKAKKYIAYFQAYTTTNASVDVLQKMYEKVINKEGVVGMAISTRPDALSTEIIDLLKYYSKKTYLWLELGAQSMNNTSLEWMNRGHDADIFVEAVHKIKKADIEVIGHLIFGLPTEDEQATLDSFQKFINTGIDGYKIHALHIIKGTLLEEMYIKNPFNLLSMDEYISLVKKALLLTPYGKVIHRLTGEAPADKLVAPMWVLKKEQILRSILE